MKCTKMSFVLYLTLFTFFIRATTSLTPVLLNGTLCEEIVKEVNKDVEYIIVYEPIKLQYPLRVYVSSDNANESAPLIVVVRQRKEVLSWQLPLFVDGNTGGQEFLDSARTLCPEAADTRANLSQLHRDSLLGVESNAFLKEEPIVSISTSSVANISVKVKLKMVEDFFLEPSVFYNTTISPSRPRFYYYNFVDEGNKHDNFETVILEVTSDDSVCMTVSIQNPTCPIYDLNNDITFEGIYATVRLKGGITVTKSKFPYGFFLVFVAKGDDLDCTGDLKQNNDNRTKTVIFRISPSVSYNDYWITVMGTFACIFFFYLVFGISFCVCSNRTYVPRSMEYVSVVDAECVSEVVAEPANTPSTVNNGSDFTDNHVDETEYDVMADTNSNREVILSKSIIYLSDLARKDPRILQKKSYSYLWHVLTVALFYLLPVIQLVLTYQKVLNDTGNQDLCYYNFLCAHPLGFFSDFNHLFSNIGYIMFGFLFLWMTYRRETWHKDIHFDRHYGIPQHYGLFYAIGVALIMEGVLSWAYHICPNHMNFQFDSSFMYVTAVLCMIKIYQTRHPDINATAYATFGVLAVAILLGMLGILEAKLYFWIAFTVLHIVICFILSVQIYYMGCWNLDRGLVRRVFVVCVQNYRSGPLKVLRPKYKSRMVLLILGNVLNWSLAGFGIYDHEKDFALYLLGIFMLNTLYYFTFYIIMKLLHGEKVNKLSGLFLVISLTCAAVSLYCFLEKSVSWELTPAGSREYNQHCKFMLYDFHDIWHFLSAVGMFFMFMVLLTLDDDLSHVHRSRIHVF